MKLRKFRRPLKSSDHHRNIEASSLQGTSALPAGTDFYFGTVFGASAVCVPLLPVASPPVVFQDEKRNGAIVVEQSQAAIASPPSAQFAAPLPGQGSVAHEEISPSLEPVASAGLNQRNSYEDLRLEEEMCSKLDKLLLTEENFLIQKSWVAPRW